MSQNQKALVGLCLLNVATMMAPVFIPAGTFWTFLVFYSVPAIVVTSISW